MKKGFFSKKGIEKVNICRYTRYISLCFLENFMFGKEAKYMEIQSIKGMNLQENQKNMSPKMDTVSKGIQNRIANAQMQLQGLSSKEELSTEEKMQKRQEIQKQIAEWNNQLRQHQMELRQEQQQEKVKKIGDAPAGQKESNPEKEETDATKVSNASMEALLTADTALDMAQEYTGLSDALRGEAKVLDGEAKLDVERGVSAEEKKKVLEDIELRAEKIEAIQQEILSDATVELQTVAKEEVKPESLQEKEKEKKDIKDMAVNAALGNAKEKTDKYNYGKMFSSVDVHI